MRNLFILALALLTISPVLAQEPTDFVELEYFFDKDPGYGRGLKIPTPPSPEINLDYDLDVSALTDGVHELYLRVKDSENRWSHYQKHTFIKFPGESNQQEIVKAEYFFDRDPGLGNGMPVEVKRGYSVLSSFQTDTRMLPIGRHTLFVRTMDAAGRWSLAASHNFQQVSERTGINVFEYFYDVDPGYGNGKHIDVDPDATSFPMTLEVKGLSPGMHVLYIRGMDSEGHWGLTNSFQFVVSGF